MTQPTIEEVRAAREEFESGYVSFDGLIEIPKEMHPIILYALTKLEESMKDE